jgi:hypothetical protein
MDKLVPFLALGGLILFVVVLNLGLIAAMRRKPGLWEGGLKALSAARSARQKQEADLDELHRRVADIENK